MATITIGKNITRSSPLGGPKIHSKKFSYTSKKTSLAFNLGVVKTETMFFSSHTLVFNWRLKLKSGGWKNIGPMTWERVTAEY